MWIDPPLGPPWLKHPCMDKTPQIATVSNSPRASIIELQVLDALDGNSSVLVGVVIDLQLREDYKQTIVSVDIGDEEELTLLVKGGAGAFLGRLVLIDGEAKRISHINSLEHSFPIRNCLSIPPALRERGIALPKLLSSENERIVRDGFRAKKQIEKERLVQAYRAANRRTLTPAKFIQFIPILKGAERKEAESLAAMGILNHAAKTNDCRLAGSLVDVVHHSRRDRLCEWFARYSPIVVSPSKKGFKAHLRKDEQGDRAPFKLKEAQRFPFNR